MRRRRSIPHPLRRIAVELREANEQEILDRNHLTFGEWGELLSPDQYLARERHLGAQAFSRDMTTWLWCKDDDVLASCETYGCDSQVDGQPGRSWAFASVFTERSLRGNGYATQMMDAVIERLSHRAHAQACVLFSDVGERIYARSGFIPVPAQDWILPPQHGAAEKGVVPLTAPLTIDSAPLRREGLVLPPSAMQLDWMFAREAFYARALNRQRPSFQGAHAADAQAIWAANYKGSELVVLWLDGQDTQAVLRAAQRQAWRCGLERVRVWAIPESPKPEGATVSPRDGELPMYRPFRPVTGWFHVQRALWV
jgi:hypothetical protein